MKSSHINWMICLYLPVAAGVTVCLALLMQMVVSTEFETSETEPDMSQRKFIDFPYICDCPEGTLIKPPLRDLYQTLPSPVRLEPDKTCEARLAKRPRINVLHFRPDNLWIFNRDRAAKLARLKKENAEKAKQDKCPLIPIPIPHNPARKHIPARSL